MTETITGVTVGHIAVFKDVNGNVGDGGAVPVTNTLTLTGEATGTGTGTVPTTLTNSAVIGKVLTGFTSGSGTVTAADTILQALQKINGNTALLTGAVIFQGTWNANTNTPTLASGTGTKGSLYKVAVAGSTSIDGISQWNVGDSIVFDGTTWDKIDGLSSEVISVAGRTGAVTLAVADVTNAVSTATSVNGHALSSNVVVSATDITTGTLPVAQLPTATSSAFGAVKPDNSTITIAAGIISAASGLLKNVQVFTANGTYTPTSGVTKALMFGIGGGGGGGGGAGSTGNGANGGDGAATTVGAILNAPPGKQGIGGVTGASAAGSKGGDGGGQSGNTGGIGTVLLIGVSGDYGLSSGAVSTLGGKGGAGIFGMGPGGNGLSSAPVGTNTGAGGAGGYNDSALGSSGGGGGGGQLAILYTAAISGTYAVTIGSGGGAGNAGTGTGSHAGKVGAAGIVIILEFT